MRNVTVKQIPEELHEKLKKAALEEGKSLNAYVLSLLKQSVDERRRRAIMRERRDEFRKFMATLPPLSDSAELIRDDRNRGHE